MANKGDIYCRREPKTGRYYAFQITDVNGKESSVYLLLDWFDERPPMEADLKAMAPFIQRRWWWNDSTRYLHAQMKYFPKDAVLVGNIPPLVTDECNGYGGWPSGMEFVLEARWETFPEETRRRFKEGNRDTREIVISGVKIRRSWQVIDDELLSAMTDYNKDLWELPVANHFKATRWYPQLVPFLETRHTASKLDWSNHGQKSLDLSRTHLEQITLCDANMVEVVLPESCTYVKLNGKLHPDLKIKAGEDGRELTVEITLSQPCNVIPALGVPCLNRLTLNAIDGTDVTPIARIYPHVESLRLVGKPGNVVNISSLAGLTELGSLTMTDIFGFTSGEFPQPADWPQLKTLWLESVPEEAGKEIKKRFKGKTDDLDVRKLRKPEWLAENLDNPLRGWDGSEFVPRAKALKAAQIYRDTRKSALAAAGEFLSDRDGGKLSDRLHAIAKEYALAFNKLDGRANFIETEEREDLCAAFDVILAAVGNVVSETGFEIATEQIYETMDEHRDW